MSQNKEDKQVLLTPAGAILALICFFLPWVKVSCARTTKSFSGPEIGGIFWLVLVSALAIIVAFFYFRSQKQLEKSRPVAILSSIVALAVIFIRYISLAWEQKSMFAKAGSKVIDCTIQVGAIGTIIGFILAIAGSVFLERECDKKKGEH
jgi:uncharacterized membrane protein (DUF485 family)